jgi:hypothetical protein
MSTTKNAAPKKEEIKATTGGEPANIMDDLTKKQAFKKFSYRGEDITKMLAFNIDDLA